MQRRAFTKLALTGMIGTFGLSRSSRAETIEAAKPINQPRKAKRIDADGCVGVIIDVQESFLSKLDSYHRSKILWGTRDFAHLLTLFKIPIVATLEIPIDKNGALPPEIEEELKVESAIFEKAFFDLGEEKRITEHFARLKKRQVIIVGCETDVCVMQSCLGLLSLGYEVYLVENLLFGSSLDMAAAVTRMKGEGATFISYKSLFYELARSVEIEDSLEKYGPIQKDLTR